MTTTAAVMVLAFLATYLLHSTVLLGAATVLTRWVLRAEAWRETVWKAALIGGVLTSAVATFAPWTPVRIPFEAVGIALPYPHGEAAMADRYPSQPADAGERLPVFDPTSAERDAPTSSLSAAASTDATAGWPTHDRGTRASPDGARQAQSLEWPLSLLVAWAAITLMLLARLGWRHIRLDLVLRDRRQVTEAGLPGMLAELRRSAGVWVPIRLTTTSAIASPLVLGHNEICVPERFLTELDGAEQRAAIAHELGHLVRRDPAWQLGAMLLECLFFIQPLHRVARRRLRETAEYLSDAWAVRFAGGRLSLARCLAQVGSWVAPTDEPVLAGTVAMAEGGSPLVSRVSRLLEREPEAEPRPVLRATAAMALIGMAAAFAPAVGGAPVQAYASPEPWDASENTGGGMGEAGALPRGSYDTGAPPGGAPENGGALDTETGQSDTDHEQSSEHEDQAVDVVRWRQRGSLAEGVQWAKAHAHEAGTGVYWVAWLVDSRVPFGSDAAGDSESWTGRQRSGPPVARTLDVSGELSRSRGFEDVVVMLRFVTDHNDVWLDRLAFRTPARGMDLNGGRIHWLGRQDAHETFARTRSVYDSNPNPRVKEAAVELISVLATTQASEFLRDVIASADGRNLREQAVEGLGYHSEDETVATLLRLAQSDPDDLIRQEAAETLGELDRPDARAALHELIRGGGDGRVREEALEALMSRPDTTLAELLLDIALHDPDESMRREAVEAMVELPPLVAVPLLRRVALEAKEESAERQAAESLGELGTLDALAVLDEILERNVSEAASFQALESIAENFARSLAIPRLQRITREHPSVRVRREALDQLKDLIGGP